MDFVTLCPAHFFFRIAGRLVGAEYRKKHGLRMSQSMQPFKHVILKQCIKSHETTETHWKLFILAELTISLTNSPDSSHRLVFDTVHSHSQKLRYHHLKVRTIFMLSTIIWTKASVFIKHVNFAPCINCILHHISPLGFNAGTSDMQYTVTAFYTIV